MAILWGRLFHVRFVPPHSNLALALWGRLRLWGDAFVAVLLWGRDFFLDSNEERRNRRKVFSRLDRQRKDVGLDHVIPSGALAGLEARAMRWEQIEAILGSSLWREQRELRSRVQKSADEFLTQIVMRSQAPSDDDRSMQSARKLDNLLSALTSVDRSAFAYSRESELQPNVPLPELTETIELLEALMGC